MLLILLELLLCQPLMAQTRDQEPEDEDDLRSILEEEDFKNYLRSFPDLRSDSLLSDVRHILGIFVPDSMKLTGNKDRNESAGTKVYRPMIARVDRPSDCGVTVRSFSVWTTEDGSEDRVRNDRSMVRWDARNAGGEGSFGEITLRSASYDDRSTSATLHYVGHANDWEMAIGNITDRTALGPIADGRVLKLKPDDRNMLTGEIERSFSRPSYMRDAFVVSGLGFRGAVTERTRCVVVFGREELDPYGATAARIGVVTRLGESISAGVGWQRGNGAYRSVPQCNLEASFEGWNAHAASSFTSDGTASTIVHLGVSSSRDVRFAVSSWRKRICSPVFGIDKGYSISVRWRTAGLYTVDVQSSAGEVTSAGSSRIGRSFMRLAVTGRTTRTIQWSAVVRTSQDEDHADGRMRRADRTHILLSSRCALGEGISATVSLRAGVRAGDPGPGRSTALDVRLRGALDVLKAAIWAGTFSAEESLTLWASHPGLLLWPVSIAYSGTGSHLGMSLNVTASDRIMFAGYLSKYENAERHSANASIMIEIRL